MGNLKSMEDVWPITVRAVTEKHHVSSREGFLEEGRPEPGPGRPRPSPQPRRARSIGRMRRPWAKKEPHRWLEAGGQKRSEVWGEFSKPEQSRTAQQTARSRTRDEWARDARVAVTRLAFVSLGAQPSISQRVLSL